MRRFIWSELLHRRGRTVTLALGILVAAVSFTLLTSAVSSSALELRGTIHRSFRSAYDILVRPRGSSTALERDEGLVRDNYLSGTFGGITMRQWRTILRIPGVDVAAPIANIGYILPLTIVRLPVGRFLGGRATRLYRIETTWVAHHGLSRYPGEVRYIAVTSRQGGCRLPSIQEPEESDPYAQAGPSNAFLTCIHVAPGRIPRRAVAELDVTFPILLAGIDPNQENRLVRLDRTVVSGAPLAEGDTFSTTSLGSDVPVIVSTRTFVDQALQARVLRVALPKGRSLSEVLRGPNRRRVARTLPGTRVGALTLSSQALYRSALSQMQAATVPYIGDYWTVSQVRYRPSSGGGLRPETTTNNPTTAWGDPTGFSGWAFAPAGSSDTTFRRVDIHNVVLNDLKAGDAILSIEGRFDPEKLPGFNPLSRVPLETYNPPVAQPADPASRRALRGRSLEPTMNLGDYLQQPPFVLTTLQAAQGFLSSRFFHGGNNRAPISAIRVRVAGVRGADPLSLARIRSVALAIKQRTGLAVDVTAGSSPAPVFVNIPPGEFGRPMLLVREGWSKKGVAVLTLRSIDRKSLALFVLVLVVTALFLVNGALASVRARRGEIGTLLAVGWSRRKIVRAVLGEIGLIGLAAGLVGTGLAALLVRALDFEIPLVRTLLVVPVAVLLAALAGLLPAWRAAQCLPMDAVRPVVAGRAVRHRVRSVSGMALANLRRLPGRTVLAAAGLFVGVGALAMLLSINLAFRGDLLGTAMGAFVSIQVRGVDYLGVALAVLLAALSVADVLFLNMRERAPELVTLRATGWRERELGRMVALEGLGIGLLGSVAGAAAGVGLSALAGGSSGRIVLAGVIAAAGGTLVALLASLVPASLVSRMTPPAVLAEE